MKMGKRIIFNKETGTVLNNCLDKMYGDIKNDLRPKEIDYVDLEFDDKVLDNVLSYHIDIKTNEIIIDEIYEKQVTKEEKLEKELLETKATIIDLKYKEVLENKEEVGK